MPTVLRVFGYLWVIHTRDHGYPHVTVYKGTPSHYEATVKIRLDRVEVIANEGFNARSISKIIKTTEIFQKYLLSRWGEYHDEE